VRLGRRAVRFVGGSLDGETTMCSTPIVYLRMAPGHFEEYHRDGRFYVYRDDTKMRDSGKGVSTTLEWKPVSVLVPV
jgi:hypothetical protein